MGIEREERNDIAVLRMSHGKANALDTELLQKLIAVLDSERESPTKALVLTGSGRIFSAGVDLFRVVKGGREYLKTFLPALVEAFHSLFTIPKPVVAAVNGHALAGGCILAAACDHRIMATGKGTMGVPELKVGVPFPAVALEILRAAFRPETLQEMVYTGGTWGPEQALTRGLVDDLAAPDDLQQRALERAAQFAAIPATSFALAKRQIRAPALAMVEGLRDHHDPEVVAVWESREAQEAIQRYLDETFGKR